jgi:hypothetical protein
MPVEAQELPTPGRAGRLERQIPDLLTALDLTLFREGDGLTRPVTIQGEPGSGKSTVLFELFRLQLGRLVQFGHGWIPVFIAAHDISRDAIDRCATLAQFLKQQLDTRATSESEFASLICGSLHSYRCLIIIDGLDEITNRSSYEHICRRLNALLEEEWRNTPAWNRYLVSCRSDDNQRLIAGRLLSIKPVPFTHVIRYLLRKAKGARRQTERYKELLGIVRQLKNARVSRLLLNYFSNPYLLSLIIEYYKDLAAPPATHLRHVFEQVLEREIRKPLQPFETFDSTEQRGGLRPYLTSLLLLTVSRTWSLRSVTRTRLAISSTGI